MTLIVGLGNPGTQYKKTRHNIGFLVIDALIDSLGAKDISKSSFQGNLFKSKDVLLLKPKTFMNLSGDSVVSVANYYKVDVDDIIVIHDDLDLPFGALRFKRGGGHGGHNGLKSVDAHMGKDYIRVRLGIDKPENKKDVANYVLHDFSKAELNHLSDIIDKAKEATQALLDETMEKVASLHSIKKPVG